MTATHEKRVEKFYTYGSAKRATQDDGFLSFGYWSGNSCDYRQAVNELINRVLQFEQPLNKGRILNVACGNGAETVKIFQKIKPEKIVAIDITASHVEFAKQRVKFLNLSDKIIVDKMDACCINFDPGSFDYIIGIEGPAHFNTRESFLKKAYESLSDKGVLLLSDILVNKEKVKKNLYNRIVGKICSKYWHMPKANWMTLPDIINLLEKIGFKIDYAESAGDKVFPGFAKYNLKKQSIRNAIRTRGLFVGVGLTAISWLLGYVYKKELIDYVLIRAIKVV